MKLTHILSKFFLTHILSNGDKLAGKSHIGTLRYKMHHSVPEMHQELCKRGVIIAERTVTNLLARYEELVTLHLTDQTRLRERLTTQGHVILALDGLQPDVPTGCATSLHFVTKYSNFM